MDDDKRKLFPSVLVKLFISHFCSVVECLLFTAPYSLILKLITQQMVSYFNVINLAQ